MKKFYLFTMLLIFSILSYGQWGNLDPTFGDSGKVTLNISSGFDNAADIIFQEDGKMIVIGTGTESIPKILVARFNEDGTIDNTFGTEGMTMIQVSSMVNYGIKGAFQSDGKILVGARTGDGTYNDFTCVRLNTDGSLDNDFATDGIFTISLSDQMDNLNDLEVLTDDKIILAGSAGPDLGEDFALVKLNPDGTLDTDFGEAGIALHDVNGKFDNLKSITVKNDGKIIGVGNISDETRILIAVITQFNEDGSLDMTFGNNGITTIAPGPSASFFNDVIINEDNTIVAAGVLDYDSQYDFLAVKFNEEGTVYSQFAEDGVFVKDYNGVSDYAHTLLLQPDGKLLLVGYQGTWPSSDFALFRLTEDGAPDNTFGSDGLVTTDFDEGYDYTAGSAVQSDGKVLACGSSSVNSDYRMAMARYISGVQVGIEDRKINNIKMQAYPNPVLTHLNIKFEMQKNSKVEITIFDSSGRKVGEVLSNRNFEKGLHTIKVDLNNLETGLYLLQMKTIASTNTLKFLKK